MQKIILVLLLTLSNSILLSANCVQEYYQLTNQAELAICDHQLAKANDLYKSAFALECNMAFKLDLLNALTVSCELNNWDLSKHYAILLRKKNYNLTPLKENILGKYFKGQSFAFLDSVVVDPTILVVHTALKQLQAFDVATRLDCPGYQKHCKERIMYVDSIIFMQFRKLLIEHGGWIPEIANLEGTEWLFIIHNSMWQRYWVQDLMEKAVQEGKFHPDIYADCIDAWHDNNTLDLPSYGSDNWWVINKEHFLRKELTVENTAARKAIFMDSLEEEKKKLRYELQCPEYRFSYNAKNVAEVPKETLDEIIKKGTFEKF